MTELRAIAVVNAPSAAAATSPSTHSRVDVVAALRSTEVVEAKDRKRSGKSTKQRSALSSPTHSPLTHRHPPSHHSNSSSTRSQPKSSTSSLVGGSATKGPSKGTENGSGGSFVHELMHRRTYHRSPKHSSGWRAPSPTSPQHEPRAATEKHHNRKTHETTDENTQAQRNSPPSGKESFYLTKPRHGTALDEPDSNGMSNSANLHADSRSNSFYTEEQKQQQHVQHQQQQTQRSQLLLPTKLTGSLPAKSSSGGSGKQFEATQGTHLKVDTLDSSNDNRTTSGQEPYKFVFPSFATQNPRHAGNGRRQSNTELSLNSDSQGQRNPVQPSTTKLAASAPIDIAAEPQGPEAVYGSSAIPTRRGTKKTKPTTQHLLSNARRAWQSLGEWNFTAQSHHGALPSAEALFSGEEEQPARSKSNHRSHGRRSIKSKGRHTTVGSAKNVDDDDFFAATEHDSADSQDAEAGPDNLREGYYPSVFGAPNTGASPMQSFALQPGTRQSTFVAGLAYAGPSVMWQSAFANFATTETNGEAGMGEQDVAMGSGKSNQNNNNNNNNNRITVGDQDVDLEGELALMQPTSVYSPYGLEGHGHAMYSFFSPMGAPPPAFAKEEGKPQDSGKRGKDSKDVILRKRAPSMKGTVKVMSLNYEAPMSDNDEDGDDRHFLTAATNANRAKNKNSGNLTALPLIAPLSGSAFVPKDGKKVKVKAQAPADRATSPPSTPPRPFVKKSSLFVASNASFRHRLPRQASKGPEPDFWDQPEEEEKEVKDTDSIGHLVDVREQSLPASDSAQFVALDRKATMYGRRWLEETGRGGLGGPSAKRGEAVAPLIPATLHAATYEPHHMYHSLHQRSPSPLSKVSSSSSSSSNENDDSESNSDGDDVQNYEDDSSSGGSDSSDDHQETKQRNRHVHHHHHPHRHHHHHPLPMHDVHAADGGVVHDTTMHRVEVEVAQGFHTGVNGHAGEEQQPQQQQQVEEEDDYARAYPTAPAPAAYASPQHAMGLIQPPPPTPVFYPPTFPGRSLHNYPFAYPLAAPLLPPTPQQHLRHQRYRQAAQMAMVVNGYTPAAMTGTRAAVYTQTFGQAQIYGAASADVSMSTPDYGVSPTGYGVPFRQTAAGSQKVHEMLGFDPEQEIRWVRSPEWRRLPLDQD